jgi:hypothetical protein
MTIYNYFERLILLLTAEKKITAIKKKDLLKIYFIYIFLICICSLIFSLFYIKKINVIDNKYNIILENIPFFFGSLISNLVDNSEYTQKEFGVTFYLFRLPLLPLLITILAKISKNIFFIIVFKNIIIFTIYFVISYISFKKNKTTVFFIFFLLIPLIIPYNLIVALNFEYEDSISSVFLMLIFGLIFSKNRYNFIYIGFFLFFLYFTKSSFFFLVIILPIIIIIKNINLKNNIKYTPLLASILAIIIWGSFGLYKTGRFPFGSELSTSHSYTLSLALNKDFKRYYPGITVDLLSENSKIIIKSEWEFYDYYNNLNKIYLKNNTNEYLSNIFIKLNFIFFNIFNDTSGVPLDNKGDAINISDLPNKNFDKIFFPLDKINISHIISKIILNISIIICIIKLLKNYKNSLKLNLEIYFLLFIILNLIPHIIGWAYSRHLVAISNLCLLYLLFIVEKKYKI